VRVCDEPFALFTTSTVIVRWPNRRYVGLHYAACGLLVDRRVASRIDDVRGVTTVFVPDDALLIDANTGEVL
jgi:hypothetical protein